MKGNSKRFLIGLALLFALVDQLSKWLVQHYLSAAHPLQLWPGVFQLSLAYNTGAAFSILKSKPQLLTGFTSLLFLVLLTYGLSRRYFIKGEIPAMALILGGALGNLLDRLRVGHVTDFFDFILIRYPVFNVADSFIFCGVLLMAFIHLKEAQPPDQSAAHEPQPPS